MRIAHFFQLRALGLQVRRPLPKRLGACLALAILSLVGCEAREAEPDAGRTPRFDAAVFPDASATPDAGRDAGPLDAAPADAAPDADPRSLADLWSPDFGPPPEDMPAEIRWMHGRMWCPGERPPRVLPDGTSECSQVEVPTDPALESQGFGCRAWPSRTTQGEYAWAGGVGTWITCNSERTVCCSGGYPLADPPPCDWDTWEFGTQEASGHIPTPEAEAWLTANNLQVVAPNFDPDRTDNLPQDLVDAFPSALNNCHPICKAPACGP